MVYFKTKNGKWSIDSPTIERYYRIQNLLALAELDEVKVRLVCELSDAPEEEVRAIDAESFALLWAAIEMGPLSMTDAGPFNRVIEVEGQRFGFIDLAELTIGELADMDTIKNHPQSGQQLHKMMAILYRPIVHEEDGLYSIEPHGVKGYEERVELFLKSLPISRVLSAIDFFFHITKVCLRSTMDSLTNEMRWMTSEIRKNPKETIDQTSRQQGSGQACSTFLQETTSSRSKSVPDSRSPESSTTLPIERTRQSSQSSNTKRLSIK